MIEGPVRFAVVGCGHIGKRHAEMVLRNPGSRLAALVDVQPLENLGIGQFEAPFFSSLEDLLASDVAVDVVTIATPNGLHAAQALQALDARCHVVIEKPMTLRKSEAEEVMEKALQVQRQVFAVMQNRYSPPARWLKGLMEHKRLGRIYMVQLNCFWNRDERYYHPGNWHGTRQLDGGTLFTQFSHFIDILYWLFGDIENIHTELRNFNHRDLTEFEDSGIVSFDFTSGGMGSLQFSTSVWDQNLESSMTVIGEHGSVKIGGQYMDKVTYCHIRNYDMPQLEPTPPGNDYGKYKGSAQNHHFVIQNVIDVLQCRAGITTDARDGMKVVEIIERIYDCRG